MDNKNNGNEVLMEIMTIFYALGIGICGVMAYLGIKGTNEAIDFQNRRDK